MKEYSYWSSRYGPAARFLAAVVVMWAARVPTFADDYPTGRYIWIGALALVGLGYSIYAARCWGAALVVGDDGVTVRNIRSTVSVPWERIDRFTITRNAAGRVSAAVRTTRGRSIRIDAIRADLLFHNAVQDAVLEELVATMNREMVRFRWYPATSGALQSA